MWQICRNKVIVTWLADWLVGWLVGGMYCSVVYAKRSIHSRVHSSYCLPKFWEFITTKYAKHATWFLCKFACSMCIYIFVKKSGWICSYTDRTMILSPSKNFLTSSKVWETHSLFCTIQKKLENTAVLLSRKQTIFAYKSAKNQNRCATMENVQGSIPILLLSYRLAFKVSSSKNKIQ